MRRIIFLLIIMLLMIPLSLAALSENIERYYTFDETTGNYVDSVHGTNISTITMNRGLGGILETATQIDNVTSYMDIPNTNITFSSSSSFTINLWLNKSQDPGVSTGTIFTNCPSANQFFLGIRHTTSGGIFPFVSRKGVCSVGTEVALPLNEYFMITMVYNSTHLMYYLNGTLQNTNVNSCPASAAPSTAWTIGKDECITDSNRHADRTIDEMGIWDVALNSSDITELYNNRNPIAYPFVSNSDPVVSVIYPLNDTTTTNASEVIQVSSYDADGDTVYVNIRNQSNSATLATYQFSVDGNISTYSFTLANAQELKFYINWSDGTTFDQSGVYNVSSSYVAPTPSNVISDYLFWYNVSELNADSEWVDRGTNDLNLSQGVAELVNNSNCVNGQCLHYNGTGTGSTQYIFGNPISENWTFAVQVAASSTSPDGFLHLFGGDNPNAGTDGDSSDFRCGMEQTNGTQFPSVTIETNYGVNTGYVLMCYKNATHLCGHINNETETCTSLNGVQKNNQFFKFGRTGKNATNYYSSGAVGYNRTLNITERQELYECLATRGDISGSNCTIPPVDPFSHISISRDINLNNTNSTWQNFTFSGNATNWTLWYNNSGTWEALFNATNITTNFYNHTGLTNNTYYQYQANATWNSTVMNTTGIYEILTSQTTSPAPAVPGNTLIINLTFDNSTDPWKDYSGIHTFTANGEANHINETTGKWKGALNLSATSGDYLSAPLATTLDDGIFISFWIYPIQAPDGTTSQSYFLLGNATGTFKWCQEAQYGMNCAFDAATGEAGSAASFSTLATRWTHYAILYNESQYTIWKNGDVIDNETDNFGNLNYTIGENVWIGLGKFGINTIGYIDEFLMYNRSNFTHDDVVGFYDDKRLGTKWDNDLYVERVKFEVPRCWNGPSCQNNTLNLSQSMNFYIDIGNYGYNDSGLFNYTMVLKNKETGTETTVCNNRTSANFTNQANETCTWTTAYGKYLLNITIDTQNEVYEFGNRGPNNYETDFIYVDRPYSVNDTAWKETYEPFGQNSANEIAYDSYNFYKSFNSEGVDPTWTCDNVDPRGKKFRENAVGCYMNDGRGWNSTLNRYNLDSTQCSRALDHLEFWLVNTSETTCTNVQALHELSHIAFGYDYMFKFLNKTQVEEYSEGINRISQYIANIDDVYLVGFDYDEINGGNGYGFGQGIGDFAMRGRGEYYENPTLLFESEQQYWGDSLNELWEGRANAYIRAYKNDSFAKYQEGWLYKFYSSFHMVENLLFQKEFLLNDELNDNLNVLCAQGREMITDTLDFNYNGSALRNDENRKIRGVQRGDSNSYEDPGSDSVIGYGLITHLGLICDDADIKEAMLYLRNKTYQEGDAVRSLTEMYTWKQLLDQVTVDIPNSIDTLNISKFSYDNANDIYSIRSNFTFSNDTVFQVDGGEERGGGHSQAQGYYLYALGEPFIDFEQVPLEDDVRDERWKNAISLNNSAQTNESTGGYFSQTCGNSPLGGQFYGMSDCTTASYATDWPDYRRFPKQYGGDLHNYIGTQDGTFGGVRKVLPYNKTSQPVIEDFVIWDSIVVRQADVRANDAGIYSNLIWLHSEYNTSTNGLNITQNRTGKLMQTQVIYTNQSDLTLAGGETGLLASNTKTGNADLLSNYSRYYYNTSESNMTLIYSHTWYYDGQYSDVKAIVGLDRGVTQNNNNIIFDTDKSGFITHSNRSSDGWALAYDHSRQITAGFNVTQINESTINLVSANDTLQIYLDMEANYTNVFVNTMKASTGIDLPVTVRLTLNLTSMENNQNFYINRTDGTTVTVVSQQNDSVTFDVSGGQEYSQYIVTATTATGGAPADTCSCPGSNTDWEVSMGDSCFINSDCNIGTGNITWTSTGTFSCNATITSAFVQYPSTNQQIDIYNNCNWVVG